MRRLFGRGMTGKPSRRGGLLRNRDGSAAVEFAMVAFPFFLMLFAIIEVALILTIDVRVVTNFVISPQDDPLSSGVFDPTVPLTYSNGAPNSWMLVRVWYKHPLITGFLAQAVSRTTDGAAMLSAATAFKNEPPGGGQPVQPAPAAAP